MLRFTWPLVFLALAATSARADIRPHRTATTPNVILILADDLGYGDLGCYGQSRISTPNIDRLAAEGMRFTQAYAGNTVCAPSRSALMTGMHSGHGRVRSNVQVPLAEGEVTLGRVCRAAGYATFAAGKWALGGAGTTGHPNRQGFDDFFGFLDQVDAHDYFPAVLQRNESAPIYQNIANYRRDRTYAPDLFYKTVTNFIRINEYSPFFIYFATTIPHANNELGTNGMQVPSFGQYRDQPWPAPEKGKAAMITRLDAQVGNILAVLQHHHLDTNTIIIFTSDNGPHKEGGVDPEFFHSSGGLRGIKRDLYEGGIRTPFIVRWPGRIRPAATNDLPIAFWDVLPTIAELVGVNPPPNLDGLSFAPALFGKEPVRTHEYFYWEFHERGYQKAARLGDWKGLKLKDDAKIEVYNLASDPAESREVGSAHPEIVAKFEKIFAEAANPFMDPEAKPASK